LRVASCELQHIRNGIGDIKTRNRIVENSFTDDQFRTNSASDAHVSTETRSVQFKVNVNTIAELLAEFDSTMGDFDTWQNQLRLLGRIKR